MKFLIIPDSFKNCLSSKAVGQSIKKGILNVFTKAEVQIIPIADGGEGTVEALIPSINGRIIKTRVHDPLMRPIDAFIGISGDNKTAIIEMAAASGIELITKDERNPLITSTFGTGELIKAALDHNCKEIIIGIGGSATNDGGVGMATALGVKFLDEESNPIKLGGGALSKLAKIDINNLDKRLKNITLRVACDVKNSLCGPSGASAVYGPQKGANKEQVELLDNNLKHLSNIAQKELGREMLSIEGGGAAGGLGAGLHTFIDAKLEGGFHIISELLNLKEHIAANDIIITAEGAVDYQTLFGKTPAGVAKIASNYQKPVFVFAGSAPDAIEDLKNIGITSIIPITRKPITLDNAITQAPNWLKLSATELCYTLQAGIQLK